MSRSYSFRPDKNAVLLVERDWDGVGAAQRAVLARLTRLTRLQARALRDELQAAIAEAEKNELRMAHEQLEVNRKNLARLEAEAAELRRLIGSAEGIRPEDAPTVDDHPKGN